MFYALLFPGFRLIILVVFACCLSISGNRLSAQTPAPSSPPPDAPEKSDPSAKPPPSASPNEDFPIHDTPTPFKVRVNLVLEISLFGLADGADFAVESVFAGASCGGEDGAGV